TTNLFKVIRILHTYTSYIIGMQFGLFQFYQHTFGFLFLKKWYLGIVHLDHRRFQLKSYFHKPPQLFSKLILNPSITKNLEMHFFKQGLYILTKHDHHLLLVLYLFYYNQKFYSIKYIYIQYY